ncbi:uncharacterized protein CC84DRAFT_479286 [Paraphaeosphaeria sporulosa]|uniref:Uncharacterized protein n=1 Tax=Paraphaeosphaeria sporulosa TaxID=1460663 RepID=A0A177CTK4_9PLEO|nr:uncharacterized protein CC84DRAFT_479286 [Paraphaeosphaeria sporulosa]OAG10328.1 hypothetical protein CC84DRAFT_479286 [Paraphaeosphaeria sporulosa]
MRLSSCQGREQGRGGSGMLSEASRPSQAVSRPHNCVIGVIEIRNTSWHGELRVSLTKLPAADRRTVTRHSQKPLTRRALPSPSLELCQDELRFSSRPRCWNSTHNSRSSGQISCHLRGFFDGLVVCSTVCMHAEAPQRWKRETETGQEQA